MPPNRLENSMSKPGTQIVMRIIASHKATEEIMHTLKDIWLHDDVHVQNCLMSCCITVQGSFYTYVQHYVHTRLDYIK